MDAVDPAVLPKVRETACAVRGIRDVHDVRARHLGRSLLVQLHADVDGDLPLRQAHALAEEIRHALVHEVPEIDRIDVHLDPAGEDQAHAATRHHFGGADQDHEPGHGR